MSAQKKYKNRYRIESNRWQYWNYSAPGSYFITINIHNRECMLGEISDGKMHYSEYGEIVRDEFLKIPEYHKRALLDTWIVMPNHVHCIITLGDNDFDNGVSLVGDDNGGGHGGGNVVEKIHEFSLPVDNIKQYRKQRRKMIIPKILGKFQMQTSKKINILRSTPGQRNWQPDYHDHIIRDDESYQRIEQYIINNPQKWKNDKFYDQC